MCDEAGSVAHGLTKVICEACNENGMACKAEAFAVIVWNAAINPRRRGAKGEMPKLRVCGPHVRSLTKRGWRKVKS